MVLVGDLNIARRNVDRARSRVRVPLDALLEGVGVAGAGAGAGAGDADNSDGDASAAAAGTAAALVDNGESTLESGSSVGTAAAATAAATAASEEEDPLARIKHVMARQWSAIEASLAAADTAAKVVKHAYKGSVTKYRAQVKLPGSGEAGQPAGYATLGDLMEDKHYALSSVDLSERTVEDPNAPAGRWISKPARHMSVGMLSEVLAKLAKVTPTERELDGLVQLASSGSSPPATAWLESILHNGGDCDGGGGGRGGVGGGSSSSSSIKSFSNGGMIDTFVEQHGAARERFTCWEQYTNRRYENHGSRIDFVLVDKDLYDATRDGLPPPPPLYGAAGAGEGGRAGGGTEGHAAAAAAAHGGGGGAAAASGVSDAASATGSVAASRDDPRDKGSYYHPSAALRACTAYGRWQQAPFEGGGDDGRKAIRLRNAIPIHAAHWDGLHSAQVLRPHRRLVAAQQRPPCSHRQHWRRRRRCRPATAVVVA